MRPKIYFLKMAMELAEQKVTAILFQDRIESGKKLFVYLVVLQKYSWYMVGPLSLREPLRCKGRFLPSRRHIVADLVQLNEQPGPSSIRKGFPA